MIIIMVCICISLLIFGVYMILYWDEKQKEFEQKLEIQEKLLESIKNRLDHHNL